MTDDYMPTTGIEWTPTYEGAADPQLEDVRSWYVDGRRVHNPFASDAELVERFDLWLEQHDAEVGIKFTDTQVNRFAQYLYEALSDAPGIVLTMNMTGKPELVDAIVVALARVTAETGGSKKGLTTTPRRLPKCVSTSRWVPTSRGLPRRCRM
ncbi:MAG: hypothetical protein WAZ75_00380, partial [Candidatus Absconditicoccaceae bacterium]